MAPKADTRGAIGKHLALIQCSSQSCLTGINNNNPEDKPSDQNQDG